MRIAITTPTGNIGRELTKRLLDQKRHELILLARTPDKLKQEQARGAKVAQGDLGDAASVKKAIQGADALFFLCPPSFAVPDYRAYYVEIAKKGAAAVKANKIKHTVLPLQRRRAPEQRDGTHPRPPRRRKDLCPGHAGTDHPAPHLVHGEPPLASRRDQEHEQHLHAPLGESHGAHDRHR